jgi:glycosyltransferase involved in cell wall biosynthesis
MRITYVETRPRGGMAHYAYGLCDALHGLGHRVVLLTSEGYELRALPHRVTVRETVRLGPGRNGGGPAWLPRGARNLVRRGMRVPSYTWEWARLTRAIEAERADLTILGQMEFGYQAVFVAHMRRRGLRTLGIVHETHDREAGGPVAAIDRALFARLYGNLSAVVVHGEYNRRLMAEAFPEVAPRLRVIQMGNHETPEPDTGEVTEADLRARYGLGDAPVVLFFGSLVPSKGVEHLVRAMTTVRRAHPEARLVIAGHPSRHFDLAGLRAQIAREGLADITVVDPRFLPIEEVPPLIRMASVVALPYLSATQSGVLQQTFRQGTAVVATTVGTLPEMVTDRESGLLVPPADPAALAAAISELLADRDLAVRLGARGLELSQTVHSWPAIAQAVLDAAALPA